MSTAAYLEYKLAWTLFNEMPGKLNPAQRSELDRVSARQSVIERAILGSPEAAQVSVPFASVQAQLAEIRQRFAAQDDMDEALQRAGLGQDALIAAIERDLRVEVVLEKIAQAAPAVSRTDAEIYYHLHPDSFTQPELRTLRHILITFDTPAEKQKALQVLNTLRTRLQGSDAEATAFAAAALKHSQCPTALEGGMLGTLGRGKLYPEIEAAAFDLAAGELSAPVESPIGLHLLRCDARTEGRTLPFDEVAAQLVERLTDKRRSEAQRQWIRALCQKSATN